LIISFFFARLPNSLYETKCFLIGLVDDFQLKQGEMVHKAGFDWQGQFKKGKVS
jgi:hypothetical protein